MEPECRGCIYWRPMSLVGRACHWALDNPPYCRLAPAKNCPYKIKKEEVMKLGSKINDAEARRLYNEGKSDKEIAVVFGLGSNAVLYWRNKNGLPANPRTQKKSREDQAMQVPSIEAISAEVREKVKAAGGGDRDIMVDMDRMNHNAEQRTGPVSQQPTPSTEVNKFIYLPEEYDPLIYDAFDLAIAKTYERGGQPGMIWRQLLRASEMHMGRLHDYLCVSEAACRCAIELAALAAVEEQ